MNYGTIRCSRLAGLVMCALVGCALLGFLRPAHAQTTTKISGQAFIDYYYQITSPEDAKEELDGLTYCRFRVTTDAKISDACSARTRLDAEAGTFGPKGPQPYVKDLFLNWKVGGGNAVRMGVTSLPSFQMADEVWIYSNPEKTLLDLNNEYKRGYGPLEFYPTENVIAAIASNWATYGGTREIQFAVSVVAGYITDGWRIADEGFSELCTFDRVDSAVSIGGSFFGDGWFTPERGLSGRADRVQRERLVEPEGGAPRIGTANTTPGLAAVAFRSHEDARLMLNPLLV